MEEHKLIQDDQRSQTRYIPNQISEGDQHLLFPSALSTVQQFGLKQALKVVSSSPSSTIMTMIQTITTETSVSTTVASTTETPLSTTLASTTESIASTSTRISTATLSTNPVRWLIENQSYNGMWILNDETIKQLTNGKSWVEFKSDMTDNKDIITTSLVIALLELKYADQFALWILMVEKGRHQMINLGFSKDKFELLIKQIKDKLKISH
ncbi:unnamed protein product [Adineta ricciae]|uniref:Uncharacterized protein n=1 Tax=Adineta ricciae TaxID=249248 RepID=A0A816CZ10_ADIRI|nr:unnamed protein product [Adineta ricciae]